MTLPLRIAAGDPSVSSAGCCIRGAAAAPPNEKFRVPARPKCSWHAQVYRWADTLGSVNSQTGKLAESDREKGDKKIGRGSITVMNTAVRPSRLKHVRNATHGSLISPVMFSQVILAGFI